MLNIGIDFGTTNCSASIYRNSRSELIPLEGDQPILPSTICITKEHEVFFGHEAIELFLSLTGDTRIRYKFTDLSELSSKITETQGLNPMLESDSGMVIVSSVGGDVELDTPARLFQSLKTGLRDPDFHGTTIYNRYFAIEELIALILGHIRACAELYLGEPVRSAVIGRPVSYVQNHLPGDPDATETDRIAHERMLAAARIAGFTHAALEFEPVGAARHLQSSLQPGQRALVFDFGGGTLDLAIAQAVEHGSPEILATHGVLVGGDDFDSAIMQHALLKHFGLDTTLSDKRLPFPESLLAPLLHWQTVPLLSTPARAAQIASIKRQSNSPQTIENLQILIRKGLGFRLFQAIEAAKIRLSTDNSATIELVAEELQIAEKITVHQFVLALADYLVDIERGIVRVLAEARLTPDQIDTVLMTGGSSLVPAIKRLVGHAFNHNSQITAADPFTSISTGLGIIAAEDDICLPITDVVSSATEKRIAAEAVTIGETVAFRRGHQIVHGLVVQRAGGRMHDAILTIEYYDAEIEQHASTMRHETKVERISKPH